MSAQCSSGGSGSRGGGWWRSRLLWVPVVVALSLIPALTISSGTARAAGPPAITVTPDTGLGLNPTVQVGGSGWSNPPGQQVVFAECVGVTTNPGNCVVVGGSASPDATGSFSPVPVVVQRVVQSQDCAVQSCQLVALWPLSVTPTESATHPLSFDPTIPLPGPGGPAYVQVAPGPWVGGFDIITGGGWPVGATLTLQIDDPTNGPGVAYTATTVAHPGGSFSFNLMGIFDVRAGQIVSVSDAADGITRTTTVTALTETLVDPGTDTVTGTAAPGSAVVVAVFGPPAGGRHVQADASGNWTANFAVPGSPPDTGTYVITGGTAVGATQYDAEGNSTVASLMPPQGITVSPNSGLSEGQHVSVSGLWLNPNSSYLLEQCVQRPGAHFCDASYQVPVPMDAKGSFGPVDFVVHKNINVTVPGGTSPVDCSQETCIINLIGDPFHYISSSISFLPSPALPASKDQCKNGGWRHLGDNQGHLFKNQGDCVSFVATGGKNPAAG